MVKVAFITGATSGIGAAVAALCAKSGYNVALLGRREERLASVSKQCTELNKDCKVLPLKCDVADFKLLKECVDKCVTELGPITFLFNNAGIIGPRATVQSVNVDEVTDTINIDLIAPMRLTTHCLESMIPAAEKGEECAIVFLASQASKNSFPQGGPYCAAKWGLLGFAGCVFEDVRQYSIKVSSILPGFVFTEMTENIPGVDGTKMIQVDDVVQTVEYILKIPATCCPAQIDLRPQKSPYLPKPSSKDEGGPGAKSKD
eukprot:TRINITY_DN67912_c0_g8_i1.p1 TRINITY_DN67912_c0_g8~~TRINITY_DN67912_c0_g8_i1.p1  ORF type:complete len:260 (+),score=24.20 TRINITY_DN67912_c0_g8_i1:21-800(+)